MNSTFFIHFFNISYMRIDICEKKSNIMRQGLLYRSWYYFRMGWATYFAFIFAAINTLVVTYYLAIEEYPTLLAIYPTFFHSFWI